jgi:hypothetical protein
MLNCRCGVGYARSAVSQSRRAISIYIIILALSAASRCQLTFPCSAFRIDLRVRAPFVEGYGSYEKWMFRFEECSEGVTTAR